MSQELILNDHRVKSLPICQISPNPYQPRRFFDKSQLDDLSESIKEFGVLQPITVRLINGSVYELVSGERRLRASKIAGKDEIPVIVVNINDQESAMIALIENLQRQDLNYFEEAEGFYSLLADFGFTQEQLAKRVGKTQSTIANKLRLLRLPKEIQCMLIENGLTERHARALLKLEGGDDMLQVLKKVISDGLNVAKTEELVEKFMSQMKRSGIKNIRIKTYIKDLRIFTNTIKQAVDMMNSSGVETQYDLKETDAGCMITIAVNY